MTRIDHRSCRPFVFSIFLFFVSIPLAFCSSVHKELVRFKKEAIAELQSQQRGFVRVRVRGTLNNNMWARWEFKYTPSNVHYFLREEKRPRGRELVAYLRVRGRYSLSVPRATKAAAEKAPIVDHKDQVWATQGLLLRGQSNKPSRWLLWPGYFDDSVHQHRIDAKKGINWPLNGKPSGQKKK